MFDNPLFVPQFVTGQAIKLRTQDGVMIDSCDANIGYLQGDVRKIKAILCDGAHEFDQWQVINLVRPDGTFYDHIAVKGAVSQDQAERLCQKYFLQGQGDYRFQDHVPVSDNSLKMFMDSTVTPTGTSFFLLADAVAYDARATQQPVIWDDENRLQSHGGHIAQVMYDMARYDANQDLLTKVTPKDVVSMLLDENCTLVMYDAMIMKYRQLDMAMQKLAEALKTSDHEEFFVKSVTPIEPFKRLGVVNVGVIFEMSDTQTVTVLFNNPDTTPGKITANDVITSWKWILNKRDVTAVLQPRAVDAKKYPLIASRMFKLLAQNHSRFKRAQALRAKDEALLSELMGQLEAAQSESNSLDAELARIDQEIDQVGVKKQQQSALEKDSKKDGEVVAKSGQDPELEAAISKVKAITELLISDFGFSYNNQSQSTNLIKELVSANGYDVSIEIEDDFSINLDGEIVLDRVDTTGSIEYIARAIAQADFEHVQDFSETGEIEDKDSIFFGKSSDYAFTIQQLDQAAKQLKLDIVFDDFDKTQVDSNGLFDSLENGKANLIYGITAQIGKNNQVLVRAKVDFDGNLELLRGASGSEVIKAFNTDNAVKKNIVAVLNDVISGNPILSKSVEQSAAASSDNGVVLPSGFTLDDSLDGYWQLRRQGVVKFVAITRLDNGKYRAKQGNVTSTEISDLKDAVQWGVNLLNDLYMVSLKESQEKQKQAADWRNNIPSGFDREKFIKAFDLIKQHTEKQNWEWDSDRIFNFVVKKFNDFAEAHKDISVFESQAVTLNNGMNDLSRILFGLYTDGNVILKGLSQKAGKARMDEYAKEIFTKDKFDQHKKYLDKQLEQAHKAALERKQQEHLRDLEVQVSSYMSRLSGSNLYAIKKWFNEGFDPIPVKVGVATRYQFVNEKEGVKYKVQNNSTYRELESVIKAANVAYGSMREALIHLGYLERQADEPTQVEDTASATVFEPTITRYSIKSTNPRARKPVGSVKLTSREDGMSDVLFVMDGVGGEYVGTIEDVKKWVTMRMQGLGSALEGKEPTFEDIAPRLELVEGEDLLGVEVQAPADDPAPVSEDEQFLNDLIAGLVDLAADETGARLESMAEGLDPALESLFEQAAEAYAQFAINNAKTV